MTQRNTQEIIKACDKVARRCTMIGDRASSSVWLFDKIMRAFDSPCVEAVTYAVFLNAPLMCDGEVTIHRDGSLEMRRV